MRGLFLYLSGIGLLLIAGANFAAGADTTQSAAPASDLAGLIQNLGDPDFHVRDVSEHKLREAGSIAEPLLREAITNPDLEIATRSRRILADISMGITPGAPAKLVERLKEYRQSDVGRKAQIVQELERMTPIADHSLARLWLAEKDPVARATIFPSQRGDNVLPWVGAMIADGDEKPVPDLMRMAAFSDADQPARNAAAYFLLSGTLDAEIAGAEKRLAASAAGEKQAAGKFLLYAYRARGDLASAARMAGDYADGHVQASIAEERGDWAGAAAAFAKVANRWTYRGRLALYYRLAGDEENAKIQTDLLVNAYHDSRDTLKSYFLNDRPAEGLAALMKTGAGDASSEPGDPLCVTLLCEQMRFREAIVLAEQQDKRAFQPMLSLAVVLQEFGAIAEAAPLFDELQAGALRDKNTDQCLELVERLHDLGLNDRAGQLIDSMLRVVGENSTTRSALPMMLDSMAYVPQHWIDVIRKLHPDDKSAMLVERLNKLFSGKLPADEVTEILKPADLPNDPGVKRDSLLCDVIRFTAEEGLDDAGLEGYAEKAVGPEPLKVLGDMLAGKGLWDRAAQAYGRAWQQERYTRMKSPLSLALQGHALEKAGHAAEGQILVERAHRILMSGDHFRSPFVYGLREHGMEADAHRQEELAPRIGMFDDYVALQESEKRANALATKDPMTAAELLERKVLWNLRPGAFFRSPTGYLIVPHRIHMLRAMGWERKGNVDAALREWKLSLAFYPYGADSAAGTVRLLDKAGRTKEANDIYTPVRDQLQSVCKDYPDSAKAHNNLAWLAARCRRDPDLALEQANKATQMEPANAEFIDTLAEVHVARGEKAAAVELMRKAIELAPDVPVFQERLKEIESSK
ncbi:MAG TPA: hypothetical protein VFE47_13990 [Tepidisphaeraceae bacterium]|jgi:tetratricopeptide (TPR) repeat protein|nr:hypothetical protein [Tepidisphaeraceae bacterium]